MFRTQKNFFFLKSNKNIQKPKKLIMSERRDRNENQNQTVAASPSNSAAGGGDNKKGGEGESKSKKAMNDFFAPKKAGAASAVAAGGGAAGGGGVNLKQYLTEPEWSQALDATFKSELMKRIENTLSAEEKAGQQVFPPRKDIFSALNVCPLSKVKVVLIGQDPYHDNNQAHGLCFSVRPGIKTPPSLANMYKELAVDFPGFVAPEHGYLMSWAKQGILMLNASLTVRAHTANSHSKCGWQDFTDKVIDIVNKRSEPAVFMLWGNFAKQKAKRVDRKKHRVVENAHPSPLSVAAWKGCKCFSKCNDQLKQLKLEPIDWSLPAVAVEN